MRAFVRETRGRPTQPRDFHVTVLFVGEVAVEQLPLVMDAPQEIRVPPFELVLDEIDTLSPANVLCLLAARAPRELLALADGLRFSLLARQVKPKPQVLRPHLTLARKLEGRITMRPLASYCWTVTDFVLAESTVTSRGSEYEIIGRWPLRTPDAR
jgi:RNA 2',3'-cyclic 3'-phosphodiesterase